VKSIEVPLENIVVKAKHDKSASEKFDGTNPKWILHMRSFDEMANLLNNLIKSPEENEKIVETLS
jgi:hypothetical protein